MAAGVPALSGSVFVTMLMLMLMLMMSMVMMVMGAGASSVKRASGVFVFGDSYADTGNHDPLEPSSSSTWKYPYGNTWPGIPTGRYSNGRVLTDYFVRHLRVIDPIPYRVLNSSTAFGPNAMVASVNFAFGGSGVFPTFGANFPNISAQIGQFRELLRKHIVPAALIESSVVLLVIAGNDYTVYSNQHPNNQGVRSFSAKVVGEMKANLQELHSLGFRRFAVTNIEPFGCFPAATQPYNFTRCNPARPATSDFHNQFLAAAISSLRSTLTDSRFDLLNLHSAFRQILQGNSSNLVVTRQSCCKAINATTSCGSVSEDGQPLYTLCSNPSQHFFWDSVHPSDHGWKLVSRILFK